MQEGVGCSLRKSHPLISQVGAEIHPASWHEAASGSQGGRGKSLRNSTGRPKACGSPSFSCSSSFILLSQTRREHKDGCRGSPKTVHPASLPSGHTYSALRRCQAQHEHQSPARWCHHASLRSRVGSQGPAPSPVKRALEQARWDSVLALQLARGTLHELRPQPPPLGNRGRSTATWWGHCEGHVGWGDQHTEALTRRHLLLDSRPSPSQPPDSPVRKIRCPAIKTQSLQSREGKETSPTEDGKPGGRTEAQGHRIPFEGTLPTAHTV